MVGWETPNRSRHYRLLMIMRLLTPRLNGFTQSATPSCEYHACTVCSSTPSAAQIMLADFTNMRHGAHSHRKEEPAHEPFTIQQPNQRRPKVDLLDETGGCVPGSDGALRSDT